MEARQAAMADSIKQEFTQVTPSGLRYMVLREGTGSQPVATSNVKVHYTGSFLNGKVFDSSVQRGEPIDFGLNQVIPGWTEGVQLMKEGAKYKFYIPYQLAYGERGYPGAIPPKSDLIFEVELIRINQ
ncbi:MAG: FKBP-type peptidyl-prolyl cis-trans isomerase [Saprospiraceae bacterium]|nr:FKBP-type peptidyl-prolyl cis-trans isomerase [Saprospiraceae bacterium]